MDMKAAWLLLAVVLAGCGGRLSGLPGHPAPSNVTASSGQFRAEATPGRLAAGDTVHVTLTVSGPIDYETGCAQTLHIWAEDGKGNRVWEQPVPTIMCFAFGHKLLAAGQTASFKADWPTSPALASGRYTIHGLFLVLLPPGAGTRVRENVPPLTIEVIR
jgi:hypothetical protein